MRPMVKKSCRKRQEAWHPGVQSARLCPDVCPPLQAGPSLSLFTGPVTVVGGTPAAPPMELRTGFLPQTADCFSGTESH